MNFTLKILTLTGHLSEIVRTTSSFPSGVHTLRYPTVDLASPGLASVTAITPVSGDCYFDLSNDVNTRSAALAELLAECEGCCPDADWQFVGWVVVVVGCNADFDHVFQWRIQDFP